MTEKSIELERVTLTYVNVSPYRLNRVAKAERERYIKDELGDVEPQPPTYTIKCGGGRLPNGQDMPTWEETKEYTFEHIGQLIKERASLTGDSPAQVARMVQIDNALETWNVYYEKIVALGLAIRVKKRLVGFWHCFGHNMPDSEDWIKGQVEDGIDASEIPTDERERFQYWLETEAVSTKAELNELIRIVEGDEEKVMETRIARDTFQRSLGQQGRQDTR